MPRTARTCGFSAASLAVVAVPGLRRSGGCCRAARRRAVRPDDRRECQKGAEASFEKYCCPAPSWQHLCGLAGQQLPLREPVLLGGTKFPCTALIPHPESGINGVLLRPEASLALRAGAASRPPAATASRSSASRWARPPAERRGATAQWAPSEQWKPSCCPKAFGCGGVCCQPPNRCKSGRCRCPNGAESCDGSTCCPKGKTCATCFDTTSALKASGPRGDFDLPTTKVGKKCCARGQRCCRRTCCRGDSCCGEKCCPSGQFCATSLSVEATSAAPFVG